jgi:hypothetical protein
MRVSFRHAWRVILGATTTAVLFIGVSMPSPAHADIIELCITRSGLIKGINEGCSAPNVDLTWDDQGEEGTEGPRGAKGPTGPQGYTGNTGVQGPQGPVGPTGPAGLVGLPGAQGPQGPTGATGQEGPQGLQGPTGDKGPTGDPGIDGHNSFFLTGGDLGSAVQGLFMNDSELGGCQIALVAVPVDGFANPCNIYYGPGNGADEILESEAVPIGKSRATQLWVQTKVVPGPGESYEFTLCKNKDCDTSVSCFINLPGLTECNDLTHTLDFEDGDTIALRGSPSFGANKTEVSWAVVLQTRPLPPPPPM